MQNKSINNIIITSNEPWSPLWFSKHHYANELAKKGHEIYFINPVEKWKLKNLFSFSVKVKKEPEGIYVINYKNNFPVRVFSSLFVCLNDFLNTWKIKRKIKLSSGNTIWWQFDFQRFVYLPFFKKAKRIYHVVDPYMHSVFDKKMAEKTNLIVCVSKQYVEYYKALIPQKNIVFIPHGVSLHEEQKTDELIIKELKQKYGEYVFFSGSINKYVDYLLLEKILNAGYKMLIAGKCIGLTSNNQDKWDQLLKHPNLIFLDVVPAIELKNYITPSVVCIVPYKFDLKKAIGSGTPLKVVKYITHSKPVITSINSGIPELDNKAIYKANNTEEFISLIKKAFQSELHVDKAAVKKYLKENTYPVQIEKIFNELNKESPISVCYVISNVDKALEFEWALQYLDKEKISLSLVLLNLGTSQLAGFAKAQGVPVYEIEHKGSRSAVKSFFKLLSVLRKLKPDILHTHLYDATILGQIAGKLLGIKRRIYTRHHSTFNHVYHPHAVKKDKLVNRLATDIVSISGNVSRVLIEREKVKPQKISLIPHCLDLKSFEDVNEERVLVLKSKYEINKKAPVIGVISRYTEWKGIQYILPAFKKLLEVYPDALLVLANARQGEFIDKIDKQLGSLPKDSFLEIRFEPDLFALYKLFDVFVHTPIDDHSEAFGQIYIESLAAKVPAVFTISGIATDFAEHGKNCYIAKHKDPESIYNGIKKILEDKNFRETIIKNGYEYVISNFALENKIKKLEELYLNRK